MALLAVGDEPARRHEGLAGQCAYAAHRVHADAAHRVHNTRVEDILRTG